MSLLLAYTFNEQSTSPWDYSGNKWTGASGNLSFTAGQTYGFAGSFGQSSASYVSAAPTSFTGIAALSIFASLNITALPTAGGSAYLVNSNSIVISINSSGTITFGLGNPAIYPSVTSTTNVATGWNTIGAVYDGSNLYIYVNGVLASGSATASGTLANPSTIFIGAATATDSTTFIQANIDCVEFRSTALSATDMALLNGSPGGVLISNSPHNFAMGDLISDGSQNFQGIVTWVPDVDSFYFYPTTAIGTSYSRMGNIGTAARQYYMEMITDFDGNGNGQIKWTYPIIGFSDYSSATIFTLDHKGLSPNPTGTQNMYAITSLRI